MITKGENLRVFDLSILCFHFHRKQKNSDKNVFN